MKSQQQKRDLQILADAIEAVNNGGIVKDLKYETAQGSTIRHWRPKRRKAKV